MTSGFSIEYGGGDVATNKWLKIIGCDSITGLPLPQGQCVELDGQYVSNQVLSIKDINAVAFYNLWFTGNDSVQGVNFENEDPHSHFVFDNCKFDDLDNGINVTTDVRNVYIARCDFYSPIENNFVNILGGKDATIIACSFIDDSPGDDLISIYNAQALILNSIFVAGGRAVRLGSDSRVCTINNTMYLQSLAGIDFIQATAGGIFLNNIFYSTYTNFVPINRPVGGIVGEDYNATNKSSGLIGVNSLHNVNPLFVNPSIYDFRPRNPLVLRSGMPDFADNPTQIGAILQQYQFHKKARTVNFGRLSIFR
jgi:hypothetical protein